MEKKGPDDRTRLALQCGQKFDERRTRDPQRWQ
jgi:hypothetical protein